jgi:hypothetical protein
MIHCVTGETSRLRSEPLHERNGLLSAATSATTFGFYAKEKPPSRAARSCCNSYCRTKPWPTPLEST